MIPLTIRLDDLTHSAVLDLLRSHLQMAIENSPAGAVHALQPAQLRQPDVTFWSAWRGEHLAGCGALRELTPIHGEIKSMRTAHTHLRQGVATMLLDHMLAVARERGYERLSLETGNTAAFAAARALYTRFGFAPCPPFCTYVDDGFSMCMTRTL